MGKQNIKRLKSRPKDTHKGDYGHVFILAGSVGLTGAAYLCSQSALLSGSGLVTLGIPESLNGIMEAKLTEVMTLPLAETVEQSLAKSSEKKILNFKSKADVLAIGPGISRNSETQGLIRSLVSKLDRPFVLDADGINAFENYANRLNKKSSPMVITPHPGEMARLTGASVDAVQRDRKGIARRISKRYNCVCVLKGARTVVSSPRGDTYINETGNPGMATAGVGDILTGILASFIGQGLDPFGAAKLAVYIHGRAGDLAMREKGAISLVARDLLHKLPIVLKDL